VWGGSWDIRRVGDVIELARGGQEEENDNDDNGGHDYEEEWMLASTVTATTTTTTLESLNDETPLSTNTTANLHHLSLRLDETCCSAPYRFVLYHVGQSASLSDTFLPPWRRGRTLVSISDF